MACVRVECACGVLDLNLSIATLFGTCGVQTIDISDHLLVYCRPAISVNGSPKERPRTCSFVQGKLEGL